MNTILKKVISLVLCFVLVVGYVPASAFATETDETVTTETTAVTTEATGEPSEETEAPSESTEAPAVQSAEADGSDEEEKSEKELKKEQKEAEKAAKKEEKESKKETEPSTEATEPSTEATEPSTEATEPSTEATEPSVPETTAPEVIAVTGITLDRTALEVGVGELPVTLTAAVLPENATDKTVTWTSSEPGVASVVDGIVEFGYMGEATITATAGDFSATCTVTVGEGEWGTYDENTTYVLVGSDFQGYGNSNESTNQVVAAENVANILEEISDDYLVMDGFLFAGDYAQNSHNVETHTTNGISLLTQTVKAVFEPSHMVFVQGNHDYAASALSALGDNDPESKAYGVYVLHEDTYPDNASTSSHMQSVAEDLAVYLDKKVAEGFDAPIFVVSHLPLHYSYRTYNNGNCLYAKYLVDVMNEGAENGLNIFFMSGHNHSNSHDSYLGGGSYFLEPGDNIYLADCVNQKNKPSTTELKFYYMSAGYVGYSNDAADDALTMTVFAITDNDVTVTRYDAEGKHNLKSAGQLTRDDASYGLTAYTDVVESPHVVTMIANVTLTHEPTGTVVTAPSITGIDVTANMTNPNAELYSAYLTYDIRLTGYTQGHNATVSVKVDSQFDTSRPVQVLDVKNDKVIATPNIVNGMVTFKTDHFSEYTVRQLDASSAITAEGALVSSGLKQITNMSGIVEGKAYVIVADEGDDATLTGTVSNNKITLVEGINSDHLWYATKLTATSANAWYLNYGSYLQSESDKAKWLEIHTKTNGNANIGDHDGDQNYNRTNRIAANGDGTFAIYRDGRYLNRYGGGESMTAATYNQNNSGSKWKIYEVISGSGASVTLAVTPSATTLQARGTAQFTPAVTVGGKTTTNFTITWASSNSSVATVTNGTVTGVADGTATITATLTHANGEALQEPISVTMTVTVSTKKVTSVVLNNTSGTVHRGATSSVDTGATMTVTNEDGTTETVNITVGTLSGSMNLKQNGTYSGLKVSYGGVAAEDTFTLTVTNVAGNNYPEYPKEGAVKVNKTATGIDFQSSGIAQVEISASGVPMKKGADVIVMLDTSSSMEDWCICGTKNCGDSSKSGAYVEGARHMRRNVILEESLKNLITQLKTPGDDDQLLDINVAIADFSRFYTDESSPYHWDNTDKLTQWGDYGGGNEANLVYTGSKAINAGAFVPVGKLADTYTLNYQSGTNYDYAFDVVYQLGNAAQIQNTQAGKNRDLYVIFLSDGAPYQYNYYKSNAQDMWNNWLQGTVTDNMYADGANKNYYNVHNGIHLHRMAEAVKGSPENRYTIIRKNLTGFENVDAVKTTYDDNMYKVPGLGATMFSIAFCPGNDGATKEASMLEVIENIASEQTGTTKYYYNVKSATELGSAFASIGSEIAYAAYNARFVDQMGDDFDLQMETVKYAPTGSTEKTETITPKIEIITYDIYTRQDYLNGTITADKIGDRKGTSTVLETVTFNATGTEAYSDKKSGNILNGGVISAQSFWYNTNATSVMIDTNGDTKLDYELKSETFYWKMGTVQTSELAMRYYVYLEGSMEGTKEGGSYPTNEFATLYYDNYLGNPCKKDTVSPVLAWKEANVSYAFYLVNENGEIIVNQTTGQTGSFANKIAVTNPVVYKTVLLNNEGNVQAIKVADVENSILPLGYELYDSGAEYEVKINSNTTGSWTITNGGVATNTTYVTQFDTEDASAYSNALTNSTVGDDYTHTIVWFAVLWKVQALPDSVVVDYGLPVDISVLRNDMFGDNGKLAGVGAYSDSLNLNGHDTALASGFGSSYTGTYGTAKADASTGKVRYTLNTMQMNGYEKFAYAVNYTGNENAGYYYDTVTVIPATTIYYEDNFLTFKKYNADGTENGTWDYEGTSVEGATQDEDRPGQYSLTDANNIYGYDSVNLGMSTFSLGQARKVHVDANSYATATFTFAGTGFDVISMTSNTTGIIAVQVTDAAGQPVKSYFVNTYYGYTKNEAGEWVATPDVKAAIYQVPVLQVEGLTYGQYSATITATYTEYLDKTTAAGYDLYMDAIRIYDPANGGAADGTTDTTIEDAYKADGEGWPSYIELRNKIITANSFDNVANDALTNDMEGLVFIDGDASVGDAQLSDYTSYGPNNEVYLAPGQRVAFLLNTNVENAKNENIVANIHIGISSANGATGTYTITNIAQTTNSETGVKAGDYYGAKTDTINTTTDMYYDLTGWKGDIIVISNTGDLYNTQGIISLTNIKATYTENPNDAAVASEDDPNAGIAVVSEEVETTSNEVRVYMTPAAAKLTLRSLNASTEEEIPEETIPEESIPEESVPESSVPETTVPEETEPEETIPETTEPEKSEQEQIEESVKEAVTTVVNTVVNALKNLFSKWFR